MDASDLAIRYAQGASLPTLAKQFGIPISRVRQILIAMGVQLRSRAEGVRLALADGQAKLRGRKRTFTTEWRENIGAARRAWAESNAAGVSRKARGYVEVTRGEHKGRGEHDLIAERLLGRPLASGEVVHHVNEVKSDNRPENLMVLTNAEHIALHRWWERINGKRAERDARGRYQAVGKRDGMEREGQQQ